MHELSLFSHALLIAEMNFDSGHQPLKASLYRNANCNAHMYASKVIVSRDWISLVVHLFHLFKTGEGEERDRSMRTLLILFVGRSGRDTDWDVNELATLKKLIEKFNITALAGFVINRPVKWYGS